jgi:hypothetical protein
MVFMGPNMTASTETPQRSRGRAVASLGSARSPRAQLTLGAIGLALTVIVAMPFAHADEGHRHKAEEGGAEIESMMRMHEDHAHEHDFEAMDEMSRQDMRRVMSLMRDMGLGMPPMDSRAGRELFVGKGCVVCHSVNGIGGTVGPSLNAEDMPQPMNAFEFAARMWRGAPAMVQMQQAVFGETIDLSGQELANIIAFAHDGGEQDELSGEQIPERYQDLVIK